MKHLRSFTKDLEKNIDNKKCTDVPRQMAFDTPSGRKPPHRIISKRI